MSDLTTAPPSSPPAVAPVPPPVAAPAPTPLSQKRGEPIISVYSLTLLLCALVAAYLMKNDNLLIVLAGVIAANATSVVNFYVGSSASSQAKDATISAQLPTPPVTPQPQGTPP